MARVLSGMQPTGRLHIGHYLGVLNNYNHLQNEHECFFMVANLHSLTAFYSDYSQIQSFIEPLVSDWLAAGIDPEKAVIFLQSDVPEHSELSTILSMYTPVSWLTRNPTYKEKQENIDKDIDSHGFLGYPVLQAADILLYQASLVPIGEDQLPHLELTREIARRFNHYNRKGEQDVFKIPDAALSNFPKVLGTDGRKMSKSYANTLILSEPEEEITKKMRQMKTDTARVRRDDPGNPENCPVFTYYDFFAPELKSSVDKECRSAAIGCKDCKTQLLEKMQPRLEPFREKRAEILAKPDLIPEILNHGAKAARETAKNTMAQVKEFMGMKTYSSL